RALARHAGRPGPREAPVWRQPAQRLGRRAQRAPHRLFPAGIRAMRLLALLLTAALAACSQGDARQKKDDAKAAQALPVSVIEVAPRDVPVSFDAVGRTEGSREVQVRARVSGILEK